MVRSKTIRLRKVEPCVKFIICHINMGMCLPRSLENSEKISKTLIKQSKLTKMRTYGSVLHFPCVCLICISGSNRIQNDIVTKPCAHECCVCAAFLKRLCKSDDLQSKQENCSERTLFLKLVRKSPIIIKNVTFFASSSHSFCGIAPVPYNDQKALYAEYGRKYDVVNF